MTNGAVSPSGAVPQGAVVTVTCSEPERYVLIGDKKVTCQSTGWSEKPECRKCGKFYHVDSKVVFS